MTQQPDTNEQRKVLIIGGGLAGLSAGCYAASSGYAVTIVEHNLALGGVCTAWSRGAYTIDGCIHWLTGGPFDRVYRELEILPAVALRTLETWTTYRDTRSGLELAVTRDLAGLVRQLTELAPEDGAELRRLHDATSEIMALVPPLDAPELMGLRDGLRMLWELRGSLGTLAHFRKPIGAWANEHLASPVLRRVFTRILPETAPALFLLMVLGYLQRGYLSRPVGGTAAFRDALERTYRSRGGQTRLHATVDEVLVKDGRAVGVRLADGTLLDADVVISTSSAPETVLRLLGGRFDAAPTRERLESWKLFDPIVLASFGVAADYSRLPSLLLLDRLEPFEIGGRTIDQLYLRVCNDDPCFAPPGHAVVQAMLPADYTWWATRGSDYGSEKEKLAEALAAQIERHLPDFRSQVRMTDVVTPLTYWNMARSWRGAYEGWMPNEAAFFGHLAKTLSGLEGFYMAGQWVEPGGGVPSAVMSGRHVVQLACARDERPFLTGTAAIVK